MSGAEALSQRVHASWDALADDPDAAIDADAVERAIEMLDRGEVRVAEPDGDDWIVQPWAKQAVTRARRAPRSS